MDRDLDTQRVEIGGEVFHVDRELTAFLEGGAPAVLTGCRHGRQVIKQENLFLVSDDDGNVYPGCGCGMGLYYSDTRFISGLVLKVEGEVPTLLSVSAERNYLSQVEYMNPKITLADGRTVPQETLYISGNRAIENFVREQIRVVNYNPFPVVLNLSLEFRADFADIFEVRGLHRQRHGTFMQPRIQPGELVLAYRGEDQVFRRTTITFRSGGVQIEALPGELAATGAIARFTLHIDANGDEAGLEYLITCTQGEDQLQIPDLSFPDFLTKLQRQQEAHSSGRARLSADNEIFNLMLNRSVRDLASLTTFYETGPYLSAGIPWFTAPFGRDGLITAFQSLMLGPDLARGTLRYLARYQGKDDDPFRDEEPGKILHERRFGELANTGRSPHTPYYGSVDSTPLFLILLSETFRWTGDLALVRELWDAVESALMWLDAYGDLDGDGFVEFERRSPLGLVVQGWKDSYNSVIHPDASLAEAPIALAEVQGYVYDAKRRIAELCYLMDLRVLGDRLVGEAEELKQAFNRAFWSEEDGFFVEALDKDKRQVRTKTSNPGHCLWSGIVEEERVPVLARQMVAPDMFSGWGVRTMSQAAPVYNPLSYHNGTVWPHDNSLIARGLSEAGFKSETMKIFDGLYHAALHFPYYRLPELFCGFPKMGDLDRPVPYPVACSPQAWAAGAFFLLLQSALGISPDASNNALRIIQPTLPPWLNEVRVEGLQVRDSRLDLQFIQTSGITTARVLNKQGPIKILIEG